jgi:hypothetical protein
MSFSHDAGFEHDDRDINSQQNVSQGDSQDDSFLHRRPRSQSQSQSQSQRDDDHDDEQDYGDGDADADRMTFVCEMDSAKELQSLLSCLANFKNTKPGQQHTAQAMVTDKDLVFVLVSKNKTTQVTGTVPQKIFKSYRIERGGVKVVGRQRGGGGGGGGGGGDAEQSEGEGGAGGYAGGGSGTGAGGGGASGKSHLTFCINLATLMDCLTIFGPNAALSTAVTMSYDSLDATFVVELENDGVLTRCTVRTIDDSVENHHESWSQMTNAFRATDEVCKAMLKSECLKDALLDLQEMAQAGAAVVKVFMSEAAPYFRLSASGNLGNLEVEFNKTAELFTIFDCQGTYEWEYQLEALLLGMRALMHADQTYLRINDEGVMCIQHRVHCGADPSYVDFLMVPTVPEDDIAAAAANSSGDGAANAEEEEEEDDDDDDADAAKQGAGRRGGSSRRRRGSSSEEDEDEDEYDSNDSDDEQRSGGGRGGKRPKNPEQAARTQKRQKKEEARKHMRQKLQQRQQDEQQKQRRGGGGGGGEGKGKRKKAPSTQQRTQLDDDDDDDDF